jgi:hypothetical protein
MIIAKKYFQLGQRGVQVCVVCVSHLLPFFFFFFFFLYLAIISRSLVAITIRFSLLWRVAVSGRAAIEFIFRTRTSSLTDFIATIIPCLTICATMCIHVRKDIFVPRNSRSFKLRGTPGNIHFNVEITE